MRRKDRVTVGRVMWEHFFVFDFCFIEVLLHDE